jgi:hypothetical protein
MQGFRHVPGCSHVNVSRLGGVVPLLSIVIAGVCHCCALLLFGAVVHRCSFSPLFIVAVRWCCLAPLWGMKFPINRRDSFVAQWLQR